MLSSETIIKKRLKELQESEIEIKSYLSQVNKKIVEIEESYLAETNLGNIIRGFDIDGKAQRSYIKNPDEREKLFSCSSYEMWLECKSQQESVDLTIQEKKNLPPRSSLGSSDNATKPSNPKKKSRKSSSSTVATNRPDYDADFGDY